MIRWYVMFREPSRGRGAARGTMGITIVAPSMPEAIRRAKDHASLMQPGWTFLSARRAPHQEAA